MASPRLQERSVLVVGDKTKDRAESLGSPEDARQDPAEKPIQGTFYVFSQTFYQVYVIIGIVTFAERM
jgi:hypothetical protein